MKQWKNGKVSKSSTPNSNDCKTDGRVLFRSLPSHRDLWGCAGSSGIAGTTEERGASVNDNFCQDNWAVFTVWEYHPARWGYECFPHHKMLFGGKDWKRFKMSSVKPTLHKWKEAQAVVMSCYLLKPLRSLAAAFWTRWRWERARKEEVAAVQTDVGEML